LPARSVSSTAADSSTASGESASFRANTPRFACGGIYKEAIGEPQFPPLQSPEPEDGMRLDTTTAAFKGPAFKDGAGDRFDDIELNMLVFAGILTDDRRGTAEMMAPLFSIDPDEVLDVPHAWVGSVDEICADLEARRERWGVSYVVAVGLECSAPDADSCSGELAA
jgi:hypothetical protein